MELGCLDLGCISVLDKHSNDAVLDSDHKVTNSTERVPSASRKSKSPRGSGQSTLNSLNKFTSQIKKPSHRKGSPLNWFPRKKADYLKKKIQMLQEVDGMNLTLDETLGDSNPHYSRVLREKIALREAADKAMEARKAALVEASWRRILKAARIQSNEAEATLLEAEKNAADAFEAATAMGVIMYDTPTLPRKICEIESATVDGWKSATHTVTASFETAFEVDKQVAAAVKTAFVRFANCSSFNKDEFKELLRKISENPDNHEFSELSSECESESGTEIELMSQNDCFDSKGQDCGLSIQETKQRKYKMRQSLEKYNKTKIVDMMLERLKCLKEDELSSLATIVATCGLNAALAEIENSKLHDPGSGSAANNTSSQAHQNVRRMSSVGAFIYGRTRMGRRQVESELPSLDKFLVKHTSKLEKEVQEAKNRRKESREENLENTDETNGGGVHSDQNVASCEGISDLGSILVKHSSRLEKEIEEAKKNAGKSFENVARKPVGHVVSSEIPDLGSILIKHSSKLEKEVQEAKRNFGKMTNGIISKRKEDVPEVPSLDQFLVKHVSKLEKEVQEARSRRKNDQAEEGRKNSTDRKVDSTTSVSLSARKTSSSDGVSEKENMDCNKEESNNCATDRKEDEGKCAGESLKHVDKSNQNAAETIATQNACDGNNEAQDSLDKILVKPVHRLEKEKMLALSLRDNYNNPRRQDKLGGNAAPECEGLDKVLVKHVSRLEREKMAISSREVDVYVKRQGRDVHMQNMNEEGSLDQILVRHKSRLEKEKIGFAAQESGEQARHSVSRREAREKELQEAWGGLSLGNSIRPHLSKLEREKASCLIFFA
ncbi:hypothetical protein Tsubulata_015416 [Turnera subulata]|uniref:Uncharacterized protein n=1 Tax=Turnera subulata TaxID=218843 RepID=A0A9Q0JFY8_9ROSI|nr:hypothetical protein Tsubulata_015416 [Turnera subulata]